MKKGMQSTWGQTVNASVKNITCILSLLMIFHAIQANVNAELVDAFGTNTTDTVNHGISGKTEEKISKTILKVVRHREETAKHFQSKDATYVATQYDYPVHTLDCNAKFDNTLTEVNGKYATPNVCYDY